METLNRPKKKVKPINKPLFLNIPSVLAARTKMQAVQNQLFTNFGISDVTESNLIKKYKTMNDQNKEKLINILGGPEPRTISLTKGYFDKKLEDKV